MDKFFWSHKAYANTFYLALIKGIVGTHKQKLSSSSKNQIISNFFCFRKNHFSKWGHNNTGVELNTVPKIATVISMLVQGAPIIISTVFWLMMFCTIRGIALIGDWFSKTCETGQFKCQSPLFYKIFLWKNLLSSWKTTIIAFFWNTSIYCNSKHKYWTDS